MEPIENPGRERILQRIGAALNSGAAHPAPGSYAELFAPVPDLLERFQAECALNHTEVALTANSGETARVVAEVICGIRFPAGEVFAQDAKELREAAARWPANRTVRWSNEGRPHEETQVSVTLAEALVAQTGSVLVSSACGGRSATVAATVHVVVAHMAQLVPDLRTLLSRVGRDEAMLRNSMLCLTSGSSRTGDIEKILVLGAHGPRRLVVVLQRDE